MSTQDDVAAQYQEDAQASVNSDNVLSRITNTVREYHDLSDKIAEAEAALKVLTTQKKTLLEDTLPQLMAKAAQDDLKTLDGDRVTIKETLRASIPKDKLAEAVKWLTDHNQAAIVKREFGLKFGRDENEKAQEAYDTLVKAGFLPADKLSVHPGTLASTLKELIAGGEDVPLPLFGGHIQTAAAIKIAK